MEKPKSFVIDRNVWFRGESEGAALLREDGLRCCVGIMAQACGLPDSDLLNVGKIHNLPTSYQEKMPWAYLGDASREWSNDDIFMEVYIANDFECEESHREKRIQKWFKEKLDMEVTFIG